MINISSHHFSRYFPSKEDSCLLTVGFDDFHYVKPLKSFRVQKFYTWHFILSGRGTLEISGATFHLQSGQMFFIPPDKEMRYYPDPEDPWCYAWFSMCGQAPQEYGKLLGFSSEHPVCCNPSASKVEMILKNMFTALENVNTGYFAALSAFYEIMDICTYQDPHTGIDSVKQLIDEYFTIPTFQISQLCADAGISHSHMLRLFKERYGTTIIKYVQNKRIEYACQLLVSTALPIRSVATSCGFADEIHFMKTFKKATGQSALSYRKRYRHTL